jgi:hypothetical protein
MSIQEATAVITQLRDHRDRLQKLADLVSDGSALTGPAKEQAQALMKAAKESLSEDYRRMATVSGQAGLNATERAFLYPAVHEASTKIRVKWNSKPSSAWASDLYDAISDLDHFLHQLESPSENQA